MKAAIRILLIAALAVVVFVGQAAAQEVQYVTGVVFDDANRNGVRDPGERGIAGVRISNGREVVQCDSAGSYKIRVDDDTIIFVIKPRNWMTRVDSNNLPRFYYIHKPNGSPQLRYEGVSPTGPLPDSVDFPLYRRPEPDSFRVIMFGDTQPYNQKQIYYLGHDVVEELIGVDAAFGVTLGDVVGDNLPLYPDLVATVGKIGIPWYNVKGNHDSNYDAAPNQDLMDETFERIFGPSYYSFDYGPVHVIMLSDSYWVRPQGYTAQLDLKQMAFLRNDLALVPEDQLVVLMMHIPITQINNRQDIYRLLENRPHTFSISAHTHSQDNRFVGKNNGWNGAQAHHHLVNGAVCGSWWGGAPDEVGLPNSTMADGTPNGYSIITFTGSSYSVRYKVARRPADYQMNVYVPDEISVADATNTAVVANVFAGSERSIVEMRVDDGEWIAMKQEKANDPFFVQSKEAEKNWKPTEGYHTLPGPSNSNHIWTANLPAGLDAGTHLVTVRTTDMYGQTDIGRRIFTVR